MLTAITALEELVNSYTASVKHLKSMDVMLDRLKEQQETLQSAVSNTNHPLHSLQAKYVDMKGWCMPEIHFLSLSLIPGICVMGD